MPAVRGPGLSSTGLLGAPSAHRAGCQLQNQHPREARLRRCRRAHGLEAPRGAPRGRARLPAPPLPSGGPEAAGAEAARAAPHSSALSDRCVGGAREAVGAQAARAGVGGAERSGPGAATRAPPQPAAAGAERRVAAAPSPPLPSPRPLAPGGGGGGGGLAPLRPARALPPPARAERAERRPRLPGWAAPLAPRRPSSQARLIHPRPTDGTPSPPFPPPARPHRRVLQAERVERRDADAPGGTGRACRDRSGRGAVPVQARGERAPDRGTLRAAQPCLARQKRSPRLEKPAGPVTKR